MALAVGRLPSASLSRHLHLTSCLPACLSHCARQAIPSAGKRLIELPRSCHLTYDESSDPRVLQLIQQVPDELWGAKLALQVRCS